MAHSRGGGSLLFLELTCISPEAIAAARSESQSTISSCLTLMTVDGQCLISHWRLARLAKCD